MNGKVGKMHMGKEPKKKTVSVKGVFPAANASRGRFLLTWVVRRPPGWALPCESELGWQRQVRWHFGREKSTSRDRETDKHSLWLGH